MWRAIRNSEQVTIYEPFDHILDVTFKVLYLIIRNMWILGHQLLDIFGQKMRFHKRTAHGYSAALLIVAAVAEAHQKTQKGTTYLVAVIKYHTVVSC